MGPQRPIAFDPLNIGDRSRRAHQDDRLADLLDQSFQIGQHWRHSCRKNHRPQRKTRQAVARHIALAGEVPLEQLRRFQIDQQPVHGRLGQSIPATSSARVKARSASIKCRAAKSPFAGRTSRRPIPPAPLRQSLCRAAFVPVSKLAARRNPCLVADRARMAQDARSMRSSYTKKRDIISRKTIA